MIALFRRLAGGLIHSRGHDKVLLGLITGTLAGMVLQSIVEAWWVGPGSPEFIYFWVMAGVGLALVKSRGAPAPAP
jgi:hypothetical protein